MGPAVALQRYLQARKWAKRSTLEIDPRVMFFVGVPNWVRMVFNEFVARSEQSEFVLEQLFWQELQLALSKPSAPFIDRHSIATGCAFQPRKC